MSLDQFGLGIVIWHNFTQGFLLVNLLANFSLYKELKTQLSTISVANASNNNFVRFLKANFKLKKKKNWSYFDAVW